MLNRNKKYGNFVRPSSPENCTNEFKKPIAPLLSGECARRIYLEEVEGASASPPAVQVHLKPRKANKTKHKTYSVNQDVTKKDLFIAVENDDIEVLRLAIDNAPDRVNTVDDYGWSLLMIACQANSVECVKELVERGADISVRDKAGNSARSLVIKNKNIVLADLLLSYKKSEPIEAISNDVHKISEDIQCESCGNRYPDKDAHFSSTIHNIAASKGKKIPACFKIPQTNKGYQIMVRAGWDKESGLGPDGTGTKYPIKTVQKKDKKGLGLERKKKEKMEKHQEPTKKSRFDEHRRHRRMEINFRREFY